MKSFSNIIGFRNVFIGFIIVIVVALFNAVFNSSTIGKNKEIIFTITKRINPYVERLDEFRLLVTRSKMLSTNWVYLQQNEDDKQQLKNLLEREYPELKNKLQEDVKLLGSKEDVDSMNLVFKNFEELLVKEKEIMSELAAFEDYSSAMKKFNAEELVESEVIPQSKNLIEQVDELVKRKRAEADKMKDAMLSQLGKLMFSALLISIGLFALVLLAGFFISHSIKKPVLQMRELVLRLGKGDLPETNLAVNEDIIGQMAESVNVLRNSYVKTTLFANEIEAGNLTAPFEPLSEKDKLGKSLIEMRDSLRAYSEEMEEKVADRTRIIVLEKKRSDELLLNILPQETAQELKETGKAKTKSFEQVSVLFTDFKGFTNIAEKMTPEELVSELDLMFRKFDQIISSYPIEKIKTIGDAYMCVGGLPVPNDTNAIDTVSAALDLRDFIEWLKNQRQKENKPFFEIRIGVHTGPVVAGVVGSKKFAYDIWGDTVNTASRMESSGEPGKVNISESTYELVKNNFNCIYRGKVKAKNKGEISMYFVEGKI